MTTVRILHLSDSHLTGDGTLHSGVVDTVAAYRRTLAAFENAGPLDLVVVSGDTSDDGSPASYRILRQLTGDFAARHGAVAVYAMGNHDQREGFRQVLGNGHPGGLPDVDDDAVSGDTAAGVGGKAPDGAGPITGVSNVAGFRVVTLDSSVPGHTHGFLDAKQLQWLREVLASTATGGDRGEDRGGKWDGDGDGDGDGAPQGSIVVVHHPPVPPVTALHHGIELQNPQDLAEALTGSDAVAILSGHYHHHLRDSLPTGSRDVPVVVTAGIVNTNDVLAAPGHERAIVGSGGTLITIREATSTGEPAGPCADGSVRTLPISISLTPGQACAEVFDLDPDAVADISARIRAPLANAQPRSRA